MAPSAHLVGLLLNPRSGEAPASTDRAVAAAAQSLGRELIVQEAATDDEIEAGFAALAEGSASMRSWCRTIRSSTVGAAKSLRFRPVTGCLAFSTSGSFRPTAG